MTQAVTQPVTQAMTQAGQGPVSGEAAIAIAIVGLGDYG